MTVCFIGLGSNLCQPMQQLQQATKSIAELAETSLIKCSSIYQSKAITLDDEPQEDYLNAVIKVETQLSAEALLDALQGIEKLQGRTREKRWGARTIDLDIILFGDQLIKTSRLTVPHAELGNRNFVLLPLTEIAPDIKIPGMKTLNELKNQVSEQTLIMVGKLNGPA